MKKYTFGSLVGITTLTALFVFAPAVFADDATIPTASDTSTTTPASTPITITLSGASNDAGAITFATTTDPQNGTLSAITGDTVTYTPNTGFASTDSFQYIAIEGATSSAPATATIIVTPTPPPHIDTATIAIRNGATLIGPWTFTLPDASSTPLSITPSSGTTTPINLPARSVLGILESLDTQKDDFSISDLNYFDFGQPYAGGLYLNCLIIPVATTTPACNEWKFNVNGADISQGAGITTINDTDTVFLYFGSPRSVTLSTTTTPVGTAFTATAQMYSPTDNTWTPASGVTIGATQPDPSNPWSPIEIATSTVNASGQAIFTLNATGTYAIGIKEDYYSPATTLTVTETAAATNETAPQQNSGTGGGGPSHSQLNTSSAFVYLASKQNTDGSYNSSILSDWTAIAFASADLSAQTGPSAAKIKLRDYLLTATPSMTNITDYERHAMALEALGINPYSGTPTDYITPIVHAFDGTQIGDPGDSDDIFAIFPLMQAGYSPNDPMIQKVVAYIISHQRPNGSWDDTADMTAAAIQAVGPFFTTPGYASAMGKAAGYLKSTQQPNGSWGGSGMTNIDSTSWVQTAINAIPVNPSHMVSWTSSSGYLPTDAIASAQQSDGAVRPTSDTVDNRVWSTSYAVVAASGKYWLSVLQSFPLPSPSVSSGGGGGSGGGSSPVVASTSTTTPIIATSSTSTSPIATSTPPILPVSTSTLPVIATTPGTTTPTSSAPSRNIKTKAKTAPRPQPMIAKSTAPAATSTPSTSNQAAAAASAPTSNFLGTLWHAITSFFSRIF